MRAHVAPLFGAITPLQSLIARRWRPRWTCHDCQQRQLQRRSLETSTTTTKGDNDKPYYITTPIFYVNAVPHVGHMYCMVLADVIKRWQVLKNRKSILLTGTDEHGMKVQRAAAKAGVEPQEFCDKVAQVFKDLAGKVDLSNEVFMRTSSTKHKEAVEYAWQMLEQRGYIYESKHEGWYSVSDETFYPQGQVQLIVDPPTGRKIMVSIETGKEVDWTSERNYHFRLSAFKDQLLEFYKQNPRFIVPETRMNEIVQQVSEGLEDLSVSRPLDRLTWGVRVPTDPSQTMYVWLDALLNYASAAGYPFTPGSETAGGWPADVHVVGKDIIRFHCIYWPAFLMALGLPLPKQILTTAHWTLGRQKMAKSTGNVVNPFFALERFGTDAMRYYLVHDGGITDDADYDNSFIVKQYKKGLSGGIGNLLSRLVKGKGWDIQRAVKRFAHGARSDQPSPPIEFTPGDSIGPAFYDQLRHLPDQVDKFMQDLLPNRALQTIMQGVYSTNAYFQQSRPWYVVHTMKFAMELHDGELKDSPLAQTTVTEVDRIIYLNAEALRLVGIMLQPFMPTKVRILLDWLGVDEARRNWDWCVVGLDDSYGVPMVDVWEGPNSSGLFPRLATAS